MSLIRNSATIGGLTLVSRVLALVRDTLMARYVGAGLASDAFLVAWRLPNLFRSLFAEGAFASAFVPMFNRVMAGADAEGEDGRAAAIQFASQVLSVLFPVLALFTAVMMIFAGQIVWTMTGGFPDGGAIKFQLATALTQITFPYLALISLVSLLGGILNSLNRFWVNAAAPVLLNICMIAALIFFRGRTPLETAHAQAIAVTVSGLAQLLWLMWSCKRAGVVLKLGRPRLSRDVKHMLWIIIPSAVGAGAQQLNLVISTSLAAYYLPQGSISYLYYADRLYQLPLGLIGIGIGTAILPALSRQIKGDDPQLAQNTQNRAMELSLMLAVPAAIALVMSALPITRALFQNGAFTANDAAGSASALAAYSVGVPAYVLIKVLTPGFYARQDTKGPLIIALISIAVNLIGNLTLIGPLKHVGVGVSTAIAAWVNVALLFWILRVRGHLRLDRQLRRSIMQIAAASVVMGAALWMFNPVVDPHLGGSFIERIIWLGALIGGGGAVYLLAGLVLGAGAGRTFLRKRAG